VYQIEIERIEDAERGTVIRVRIVHNTVRLVAERIFDGPTPPAGIDLGDANLAVLNLPAVGR
jgi:hypothetical protein